MSLQNSFFKDHPKLTRRWHHLEKMQQMKLWRIFRRLIRRKERLKRIPYANDMPVLRKGTEFGNPKICDLIDSNYFHDSVKPRVYGLIKYKGES
jgi:hypothetical protein